MSTTVTTLASLDKVREEAKQRVATALPDAQSKAKAADDLINQLNSPEVKKQAYKSVRSLAQTIRDIRKGFMSVADALVTFDSKNFLDQHGNILSLGPQWKPLIEEFDTTLQFSLIQATDASVMMKTVTAVLGSVAEADGKDLTIELAQFMADLGPKEAGALNMKTRFQKLADDVILFNVTIDVALKKADEKIKADLENARTRVTSLTQELETWNQKINVGVGEVIGAVAAGAGHAVTALFSLDFSGMMSAFDGISNAVSHEAEMQKKAECEQNINLANQEINELLARNEDLAAINLDMHSLNEALSSQLKGNPVITKFFLKKLSVAKEIYAHLTVLLDTYVEQTNAANPAISNTQ
ncbi:hypothetical protein B0H16DRAFT_1733338 [Mycena metata]|uniref:Uncharacterized protein n=1 Tax=Mycena metata TaxID=1033252 RepID=A0AAD7I0F2_9AGAR|nr:hypothetical protein B0H16DRAFT_1734358 [Mycena metata]KAJ7731401.1 hypothetical protein B0H16DRAFT_1733338 [Mycena metata]